MDTYYDLLGLLIEKFGGAESTTIIIESIEAAISKIKPLRVQSYMPLIVAFYFKQHLNSTLVIPSISVLLHHLGYSSKGYIQKKQKLMKIGVIFGSTNQTLISERLVFLDHLVAQFPIDNNFYLDAKILLSQYTIWKSCRPAVAACCVLHLFAKKNNLNYPVYILANYLKIACGAVYNQIKRIENNIDTFSILHTSEKICESSPIQ